MLGLWGCVVAFGLYVGHAFSSDSTGFILMTTLYNEQHPTRQDEFIECLLKNLESSAIDRIVVLYEGDPQDVLFQRLVVCCGQQEKISFMFIKQRPYFSDFFKIANEQYAGHKIIVSNADIYFDESLYSLSHAELENTLICLTRWSPKGKQLYAYVSDAHFRRFRQIALTEKLFAKCYSCSADSWIFLAPIGEFDAELRIGIPGCEKVGYNAYLSGMRVKNPAFTIISHHLHASDVRTYDSSSFFYPAPFLNLRLTRLSDKYKPPVVIGQSY